MQWILACVLGVGLVSLFPRLPSLIWLLPLLPILWTAAKYKSLRLLGGLCFGIIWAVLYGWQGLSQQLPSEYENHDFDLVGQVVGLPAINSVRQRFTVKVKRLRLPQDERLTTIPGKININWYNLGQQVRPGEVWQFRVRLKRPRGFANPGLFNYETWLFQQGIGATGYVRDHPANRRVAGSANRAWFDRLRYRMLNRLKQHHSLHYPEVLTALLIGERRAIASDLWQLFTATGTNHLFVISGLHVGFVALCSFSLVIFIGRWLPLGATVVAVQQLAALAAVAAAAIYSLLAGFGLPTQRALVMLLVLLLGRLLKREVSLTFCLVAAV